MTLEMIETRREQAAVRHFARSAAYRLLSQATMYPSDEVITTRTWANLLALTVARLPAERDSLHRSGDL